MIFIVTCYSLSLIDTISHETMYLERGKKKEVSTLNGYIDTQEEPMHVKITKALNQIKLLIIKLTRLNITNSTRNNNNEKL